MIKICSFIILGLGVLFVSLLDCSNGQNGLLQQWSQWTELPCSKICGGGRKRKNRVCIGGTTCPGLNNLETVCNVQLCPLFGVGVGRIGNLGQWSQWTELPCSAPCGGGRKRRTRFCIGGLNCPGLPQLETVCNLQLCPNGLGRLGRPLFRSDTSHFHQPLHAWNQWSICSAPCGGGRQQRTRVCIDDDTCPGQPTQRRTCNHHLC